MSEVENLDIKKQKHRERVLAMGKKVDDLRKRKHREKIVSMMNTLEKVQENYQKELIEERKQIEDFQKGQIEDFQKGQIEDFQEIKQGGEQGEPGEPGEPGEQQIEINFTVNNQSYPINNFIKYTKIINYKKTLVYNIL